MRIGFDRQTFTIQRYGGISRYFSDLYFGLSLHSEIEAKLLFNRHQNAYLHGKGAGKQLNPKLGKVYAKILRDFNLKIPLAKNQDIHHSTYYLGKPDKKNTDTRLVSTLYDMIPELHPSFFKKNSLACKIDWFKKSDLIISISDSSASDLTYFYPYLTNRICRIHLYSGFTSNTKSTKPYGFNLAKGSYILYVGCRGGYKNASTLIRAFSECNSKYAGLELVFAGGGKFTPDELSSFVRLGIQKKVKHFDASDPEIWHLYKNAAAVFVTSLAEGFSFPLVEGLVADLPVICSDIPVHKEIANDFATLVNPLQFSDWAEIIDSISKIPTPSEVLGCIRYKSLTKYFSKERMVDEHIKAYRSIL